MADENTNQQVITNQSTSEVIGLPKQGTETARNLDALFTKMEEGKQDGKTAKEVIAEQPKQDKQETRQRSESGQFVKQEKKEEKKAEPPKQEVKEEKKEEKSDDPRAALLKAFEERQEKKNEEVKKEETQEQKSDDDVREDELAVLPHDKPKTAKRIQALLKKYQDAEAVIVTTRKEAEEKAKKLSELEEKLKTVNSVDPKVQEDIKKQQDELAMFRRRYELDNDPEVKTKFDERVKTAEDSIVSTLKKRNAGDALLKLISDEGGWSGFSASSRLVSIPDGEGGNKQVSTSELADIILQQLPLGERKAIEAAMMEQVQTKRDRERYFKEEQAKATEYFKKKDEESQKGRSDQERAVGEAKKTLEEWRAKVESSDWIKDREIPANATAEQKAEIEQYNKYNAQLKGLITKAIHTQDLNGMLDIIQDSVLYHAERRTTNQLKRENDRLKVELVKKDEEFSKFKNAGRSIPKSGSISVASQDSSRTPKKVIGLENAFSAIEQGIDPSTGESRE